jgi:hypothetical protein
MKFRSRFVKDLEVTALIFILKHATLESDKNLNSKAKQLKSCDAKLKGLGTIVECSVAASYR